MIRKLTKEEEIIGRAFYLAMYEHQGGVWCGVNDNDRYIWVEKGKDFLRRLDEEKSA